MFAKWSVILLWQWKFGDIIFFFFFTILLTELPIYFRIFFLSPKIKSKKKKNISAIIHIKTNLLKYYSKCKAQISRMPYLAAYHISRVHAVSFNVHIVCWSVLVTNHETKTQKCNLYKTNWIRSGVWYGVV